MLSKKENQLNFACFKLLATLNVIPLEFTESGIKSPSRCKRILWCSLLIMVVGLIAFNVWLMVSKLKQIGLESIPTLPLDYILIAVPVITVFIAAENFLIWPETTKNWLSNLDPDPELLKWQARSGPLFGYTYLETYTRWLVYGVYPATIAVVVAYTFVYILPLTEELHICFRVTLVLLGGALYFSSVSWLHFAILIHITFMEKLGLVLNREIFTIKDLRDDDEDALGKIRDSITAVKELCIETNAFNSSQRYLVFSFKLLGLCCVVFCGFAAIEFSRKGIVLAICNVLVMAEAAFGFIFSYDKGFNVPRSTARLQKLQVLRLKQHKGITETQRAHAMRQLRSLRKLAVQVGNFHQLQRVSSPTFLDFSVKNIVRLVMFYRKYVKGR